MTVTYKLHKLSPEEEAHINAEVEAAAKMPFVYDPDCPSMTDEELAEFQRQIDERGRRLHDFPVSE